MSSVIRTMHRNIIRGKAKKDGEDFTVAWREIHPKIGKKRKNIGADRSVPFALRLKHYRDYVNMVHNLMAQAEKEHKEGIKDIDPEIEKAVGSNVVTDNPEDIEAQIKEMQ